MTRKHKVIAPESGFKVVLVDDDRDYLLATATVLEREGHLVFAVSTASEALRIIKNEKPDVLLLDYFLGSDSAENLVTELRTFDRTLQVVLQTGYTNEQPPRELLRRLDIQGYHDKSEGPEKLLLWTTAALKAASALRGLERSRRAQSLVLSITQELHKSRPLADVLDIALRAGGTFIFQLISGVFSSRSALAHNQGGAPQPAGYVALLEDDGELVVWASSSLSAKQRPLRATITPERYEEVERALRTGQTQVEPNIVLPLRVGENAQGVLSWETKGLEQDAQLLQIFANQVAVAIRNAQLYEMAALDPLTGVHARRFFDQWLLRETKAAFRARQPLSLLMMDLDGLKQINDGAGHLVGDQALALAGKVLRETTRDNDVVGRYGGDEFAIVLPRENARGATEVAQRITERLSTTSVVANGHAVALAASIGVAVLEPHEFELKGAAHLITAAYFSTVCTELVKSADAALYAVKRNGGGALELGAKVEWPALLDETRTSRAM